MNRTRLKKSVAVGLVLGALLPVMNASGAFASPGSIGPGKAPPTQSLIRTIQCMPGGGGCAQWGWCWRNFLPGGKPFLCCKVQCR